MRHIEDILFTNEECKSILSLATKWRDSLASPAYANLYSSKKDNVRKSSESKPQAAVLYTGEMAVILPSLSSKRYTAF